MDRLDMPQGTLDLLILKSLSLSATHGWAKFYELTRAGWKQLARETAEWEKLTTAVGLVRRMV